MNLSLSLAVKLAVLRLSTVIGSGLRNWSCWRNVTKLHGFRVQVLV